MVEIGVVISVIISYIVIVNIKVVTENHAGFRRSARVTTIPEIHVDFWFTVFGITYAEFYGFIDIRSVNVAVVEPVFGNAVIAERIFDMSPRFGRANSRKVAFFVACYAVVGACAVMRPARSDFYSLFVGVVYPKFQNGVFPVFKAVKFCYFFFAAKPENSLPSSRKIRFFAEETDFHRRVRFIALDILLVGVNRFCNAFVVPAV